jgi:hypothetical protein
MIKFSRLYNFIYLRFEFKLGFESNLKIFYFLFLINSML